MAQELTLSSTQNLLLMSLPPEEFAVLQPNLEWMEMPLRQRLSEADERLEYAYFPATGYCSIIAINPQDVRVEAGIIGREGFLGAPLVLRVDHSPYEIIIQADLRALRIPRARFQQALKQCPELNAQLLRYIHIFTLQTAHTSLANAHYKIEERLARWLLMCHDRADSNELTMTHEFLSLMLAVRRSGITDALHELEGKRMIRSTRGRVKILNRPRLEQAARGAYGIPEAEYERLIAPMRKHVVIQREA
jgi:CRP-like cAMP-binding protein